MKVGYVTGGAFDRNARDATYREREEGRMSDKEVGWVTSAGVKAMQARCGMFFCCVCPRPDGDPYGCGGKQPVYGIGMG